MFTTVTTAIVGAGPAGIAVSEQLSAVGHDHVVLERGDVGETWRSQRWDGFRLNGPNWMSAIPGPPGAFGSREDIVASLEQRARVLPVQGFTAVEDVRAHRAGYLVSTSSGTLIARNVVLAGGAQNVPSVPAFARGLSASIEQLHAAGYIQPDALPDGRVLVVGSAQSGVQIAEELLEAGREVLLATSHVGRVPRRHRGRELFDWWREMSMLETPRAEAQPHELAGALPQLSGTHGGHTVSLQQLAREGVMLLGRLQGVDGARATFADDLAANVALGDFVSARVRSAIDGHIAATGQPAMSQVDDPAEASLEDLRAPASLDLRAIGVSTVIWATGFRGDFSWLRVPVLDERGLPRQRDGVTPAAGLYVLGLPWMTHRSSGNLWGVRRDAAAIAARILDRGEERRAA